MGFVGHALDKVFGSPRMERPSPSELESATYRAPSAPSATVGQTGLNLSKKKKRSSGKSSLSIASMVPPPVSTFNIE